MTDDGRSAEIRVAIEAADRGAAADADVAQLSETVASAADAAVVEESRADLVITVGEDALSEAASRRERRPVLPVGLDAPWSPAPEAVAELLAAIDDRRLPTVAARPLVVSAADGESIAAFDTTVVTSEPARISEYAVSADGRSYGSFRADGVVVASPLGSYGYGRAAGGPQLAFGTGLAVVPIAPFATIADAWVVEPPVTVCVERDDPVSVFADTACLADGRSGLSVDIAVGEPLSLVDVGRLN
ncbi:MAG: hypothetical protein ACOC0Z_01145 [Halohasta sp.]